MPVNAQHPKYTKFHPVWHRCRAVVDGEDAVKAAGEDFLPRLSGQTDSEYEAYKMRASFFAGTGRTVEAMLGMLYRTLPTVVCPESSKAALTSISTDRKDLVTFSKAVSYEVCSLGRVGILVDSSTTVGGAPYLALYTAESIINWSVRDVAGRDQLEMVALLEHVPESPEDPFNVTQIEQIRVLQLIKGAYKVSVFRKRKTERPSKEEWELSYSIEPMIRGARLSAIPFVFIGTHDLSPVPSKPPVSDIAAVNLSHYRSSADLEHGRHFTALPTPWAAGFDMKGELKIGSGTAWVTEDPQASCGFLEFSGAGLGALENALKQKQADMAILGSRILEEDKLAAEAAQTHRMRKSGEHSILSALSSSISSGLTAALVTWLAWLGGTGTISLEMNRDFVDEDISPDMLRALMEGVQSAAVSWDTFFYNAKKADLYPDDIDAAQEKALIELGMPMPPTPERPDSEVLDSSKPKTGAVKKDEESQDE